MAADELGCGVDHDVCAVLNGADQVGGAEGVVNDQGQAVTVGDLGNGVDIGDVGIGVAQGLNVDGLGVGLDGGFYLLQIVGIHEGGGDAVLGQGVGQQVAGAAVDGLLRHNVLPLAGQGLDGIDNGCSAGGHGQAGGAALQGCNALLENILGGVGQAAIDVAGIRQAEPVGGVLTVVEDVRGGGVNGYCPGIAGRVCLLLTDVQLKGLKMVVAHNYFLISIYIQKCLYSFRAALGGC